MEIDEANRSAYIWGYIAETLQKGISLISKFIYRTEIKILLKNKSFSLT